MPSLILTAFGPFANHVTNPSENLISHFPQYQRYVLPVSYKAVDDFIQANRFAMKDTVLMLGVSDAIPKVCIEKTARNRVDGKPDVFSCTMKPGKIQERAPSMIKSNLFKGWRRNEHWDISNNAGTYLCNYLYYRMLLSLPKLKVGFVHVPPFNVLSENDQIITLRKIITKLEVIH